MKLFVGVTDNDWFDFLAARQPDEVNFWRPSGTGFAALDQWEPFLFKLHSPLNFIVGGGFYANSTHLPLSIAWEIFKEKNGMPDFLSFREKILKYRSSSPHLDPTIGCIVLTQPFFFERRDWIPLPQDWSPNIVVGKTYDTTSHIGTELWSRVNLLLQGAGLVPELRQQSSRITESIRYGEAYLTRPRLGQGGFRTLVTDTYHRRCAITGERTLPVLQASHIKPYAQCGPHSVDNGLLLRADLHILFDRGYLTLTKDYHVEVSPHIKEEFENGHEYYAMHGEPLTVIPRRSIHRPSSDFIEWHNQNVYRS